MRLLFNSALAACAGVVLGVHVRDDKSSEAQVKDLNAEIKALEDLLTNNHIEMPDKGSSSGASALVSQRGKWGEKSTEALEDEVGLGKWDEKSTEALEDEGKGKGSGSPGKSDMDDGTDLRDILHEDDGKGSGDGKDNADTLLETDPEKSKGSVFENKKNKDDGLRHSALVENGNGFFVVGTAALALVHHLVVGGASVGTLLHIKHLLIKEVVKQVAKAIDAATGTNAGSFAIMWHDAVTRSLWVIGKKFTEKAAHAALAALENDGNFRALRDEMQFEAEQEWAKKSAAWFPRLW